MSEINTTEEFDQFIRKTQDGNDRTNIKLIDSIINIEVDFNRTSFNIVEIYNCEFNSAVKFILSNFTKEVKIIKCVFNKEVDFYNSIFENKARFHETEFKNNISLNNVIFKDLADFWSAQFHFKTIFYKTDFLGTTVFSTTIFHKNVLFTYSLIDKIIIFRGTEFKEGLDLAVSILSGNLSPFDIRIEDYESENDVNNDKVYEDYISNKGIIVNKNKRETFRILKTYFLKNNNSIDYLKYSTLEQKTYQVQLKSKVSKNLMIKKHIEDYIILGLNYISNRHGKSFMWGISFTFIVGFIFFYFSLIATENFSFGFKEMKWKVFYKSVKYYFTFMTPTHKVNYLDAEKPKTFFYIWDFVGRAFVAYGIYQTVQAFRKFKK